ncbi:hypothetical protein SISNIDRAFT_488444 [Sistotremastrum niveocremeum HHB9708]|uniref:Retrotransposon gag domain-containing protein n=1 Tax=Sistotremastrum niveocremeum HHB9708 TaxID=1314777 RepID=A0A164R479_9AGAM|nr:hypothetical protein SISNIDRAFT_488444 [Sistotremastrum niveocremeum HHB9708]
MFPSPSYSSSNQYSLAPSFTGPIQPSSIVFWLSRCSAIFQSYNDLHSSQPLTPRAQIRQAGLALIHPETSRWWDAQSADLQALTSWNEFVQRFKDRFLLNNSSDMGLKAERAFYTFRQNGLPIRDYVGELEERRAVLNECNRSSMVDDVQYKRHLLFGADEKTGRDVEKVLQLQGLTIDTIGVEKLAGLICEIADGSFVIPAESVASKQPYDHTSSQEDTPPSPTIENLSTELHETVPAHRDPIIAAHPISRPPSLELELEAGHELEPEPEHLDTQPEQLDPPLPSITLSDLQIARVSPPPNPPTQRLTPAPLTPEERRSIAAAGGCFKCRRVPSSSDWVEHKAPTCPGDPSRGIPPGPRYNPPSSQNQSKSRHKKKSSSVTTIAVPPAPAPPLPVPPPPVEPQWFEEQAIRGRSSAASAEEVDYDNDFILKL